MKNIIKFICFLVYTVAIFVVTDYQIIFVITAFQILLMIVLSIPVKNAIKSIVKLIPFILFTIIINAFVMEIKEAIFIGIRLILVCHITYIFGKKTTAMEISKAIEGLLFPLTLFKVNVKNIGIMVSIAITFIPIIKQEIENIKSSLLAKGFELSFINKVKHINYLMEPLFYSLLKRVKEMEEALKSKAYIEE